MIQANKYKRLVYMINKYIKKENLDSHQVVSLFAVCICDTMKAEGFTEELFDEYLEQIRNVFRGKVINE